ncbi:DUF4304 domain-containing protein [Micromonospora sp.]|uniref:DUF4304 domain-containing protein n=1 Tax=Micromonospora sp. TaxID=1876 RepID=UPI003B3A033A
MTGSRSLLPTFVEGLAAHLAGYGFTREGGTRIFRRYAPTGDALIMEVQSSDHSTRTTKAFYLNVAFVLAPQWESWRRRTGLPDSALPSSVDGIWRHRIGHPVLSGGDQWRIHSTTAATVAREVRRRVDETVPQLLPMLERDQLFVDAARIFAARSWQVRAWLLAVHGPSEELDRMLARCPPNAARMIRDHLAGSGDGSSGKPPLGRPWPTAGRDDHARPAADAVPAVRGWTAEEDLVPLLRRISGCIAYPYDDLDEAALTGALDDQPADGGFCYPLMGIPPLTVRLARPPGCTRISVEVDGPLDPVLTDRLGTLLTER